MISFILSWFRPQKVAHMIVDKCLRFSQFALIAIFAIFLLIQSYIFFWILDVPPSTAKMLSLKGMGLIFLLFLMVGGTLYALMTSIALFVYIAAKSLNGVADIPTTRASLLWGMTFLIPATFLFNCALYSGTKTRILQEQGGNLVYAYLTFVLLILLCIALLYGMIFLIKSIAEINKFSFWRSLISVLCGTITGSLLVLFLFKTILPMLGL